MQHISMGGISNGNRSTFLPSNLPLSNFYPTENLHVFSQSCLKSFIPLKEISFPASKTQSNSPPWNVTLKLVKLISCLWNLFQFPPILPPASNLPYTACHLIWVLYLFLFRCDQNIQYLYPGLIIRLPSFLNHSTAGSPITDSPIYRFRGRHNV